ncbi:MAG: hypothetical protein LQ351_007017 [Letrouitia transgressa]|nr:MAG: hypothetical protein LQ351_007017 [Letrouitia transgressa]
MEVSDSLQSGEVSLVGRSTRHGLGLQTLIRTSSVSTPTKTIITIKPPHSKIHRICFAFTLVSSPIDEHSGKQKLPLAILTLATVGRPLSRNPPPSCHVPQRPGGSNLQLGLHSNRAMAKLQYSTQMPELRGGSGLGSEAPGTVDGKEMDAHGRRRGAADATLREIE